MEASRACPLSVGNAGNGRYVSPGADVQRRTAVTHLPDTAGGPVVTGVTGVTGVTRWRLKASAAETPKAEGVAFMRAAGQHWQATRTHTQQTAFGARPFAFLIRPMRNLK